MRRFLSLCLLSSTSKGSLRCGSFSWYQNTGFKSIEKGHVMEKRVWKFLFIADKQKLAHEYYDVFRQCLQMCKHFQFLEISSSIYMISWVMRFNMWRPVNSFHIHPCAKNSTDCPRRFGWSWLNFQLFALQCDHTKPLNLRPSESN